MSKRSNFPHRIGEEIEEDDGIKSERRSKHNGSSDGEGEQARHPDIQGKK